MCSTPVSWSIRHCRPSANFAAGCDCKNNRRSIIHLHNVLGADIAGREDGNERSRGGSLFYAWPSLCLLALDEANGTYNLKSEFTRSFDRLHCGGAGRADIIDDHYTGTLLAKALDTLAGPMLFFGFAHEKPVQLAAYNRDGRHDWVSPVRREPLASRVVVRQSM